MSILQLAGGNLQEVSDQFDGIDLVPAMNDIQNPSTRTLYFRFWFVCDNGSQNEQSS